MLINSHTVFLLGAGFSKPAGIPLLSGFVDRMLEIAVRGVPGENDDSDDVVTLRDAMKIRGELDGYHGRAHFDDRNIEDILSILSFNVLGGGRRESAKLATMARAIAKTIELSCAVKHPGVEPNRGRVVTDGPELYRRFWKALFSAHSAGHKLPALLTFNYDLVLERSLLQVLIGTSYGSSERIPFERFRLNYHTPHAPTRQYKIEYVQYDSWGRKGRPYERGTMLKEEPVSSNGPVPAIEILKLHGSLNFPKKLPKQDIARANWASALDEPFILPPVFNKLNGNGPAPMWRAALERLRNARNVIIVGYSLPQTDIYMQYFLKAAIGPNRDLDRIVVFDPVLFTDGERCADMRRRYETCFAPQLRNRIQFTPVCNPPSIPAGTTEAFVQLLEQSPKSILF